MHAENKIPDPAPRISNSLPDHVVTAGWLKMQDVKMTDHQNCRAWNCNTWNYKTGNCRTWKCRTWKCRTWKWRTKNDARARAWNGMLNLYSVYSAGLKRSPLVCSFVSCYFIPAFSCPAILCPAHWSVNFTSVIFTSSIFSSPRSASMKKDRSELATSAASSARGILRSSAL